MRQYVCLVVALLTTVSSASLAQPAAENPLKNLRIAHPRLFLDADEFAALGALIKTDPQLKRWAEAVRAEAEKMLDAKPVEHRLVGPRMLTQSRLALQRISTLAGMYRIDGDKRFADRARQEMLVAADFPDWNPSHFLDLAEMTTALGIGYDWLYDHLTPDERKQVRGAIVTHGLKPGLEAFKGRKPAFWTKATHNWSQVCNGGLTVGALAIAEDERELATQIVLRCRDAVIPAMKAFEPDGGFSEGPGYWNYATLYNVYHIAALESALGYDWKLKEKPGFAQTGFFRIHTIGPTNKTFNYADAGDGAGPAPQMFWLGKAFDDVAFTLHEQAQIGDERATIFHLVWWRNPDVKWERIRMPLDTFFRGVNVVFFRSAWRDELALYVGFKGGDNKANHSHLDLGSFVLDARGKRWAVDLGGDNYNLPGYFGKERWNYYRLRTESHNTLTLDGENQDADAEAPVSKYVTRQDRSHAIADLTTAYGSKAKKVRRGLAMIERKHVLVQDEVETKEPVAVRWNFLTPATIAIEGYQATLTQGDEKLKVRILSPKGAAFEVLEAKAPPPQRQQPDISNLTIKLPNKVSKATIVVLISPRDEEWERPVVEPLDEWPGR